jgi:hypothetical protein
MQNHWLSATNFERMYDLALAITTLSLYYKTKITGLEATQFSDQEIQEATGKVNSFLEQMRQVLKNVELNPDHIITGTSPRFGEIVIQYRTKRQREITKGNFYSVTIDHVITCLQTMTKDDNLEEIVGYLHDMRVLIDESSATDINNLLGDLR